MPDLDQLQYEYEERCGIKEFLGNLPREQAEREAYREVYGAPDKERVSHTAEDFPVSLWQRYASPVWMDINPNDTLQRESAREDEDERHICPLQLEVIRRGLLLWSNPGDLVLSPFAGIGSEGYVALQQGRRFVGCELKESYFLQAVGNLKNAKRMTAPLFTGDIQ